MLHFIIHENAGKGRGLKAERLIEKRLAEKGVEYEIHRTGKRGDGKEIARRLCEQGARAVIAVGGDGTVHEVLNGIDVQNTVFGIIPAGTGNDFAATAGIPENFGRALDIILQGNVRETDYLDVGGVRGANIAGTGIDVDILVHYATKKYGGKLQYFMSLLHCLRTYTPRELEITDEKGNKYAKKAFILCACNGKRFGGGIRICPNAEMGDGLMNMIIVGDLPRRKYAGALLKLVAGRIEKLRYTETVKAVRFSAVNDAPVEIDGEIYDNVPFDVRLMSGLKMFLSK